MVEKHILLADSDSTTLEELRQALGAPWILTHVVSATAALEELKKRPYQGVVLSFYLSDALPGQLLNRIRSKYPQTVRFVVAAEKDRARVVKEALGAHQLLIKPFSGRVLIETIERAIGSQVWINNEKLHKLVTRMRALPTVPALYTEIVAALRSPDISVEAVGELIAKDMAITTKILQVINSAYFGLPRTVTNPEEALGLLGFETVKSMVMTTKLLSQYDRIKLGDFSIERLWQHSTAVAQNARQLVLLQNGDRSMAEDAFAAGLLHDVGKAVLAANFSDQYKGVESLARKQQMPSWEVEREIFGASHGEVGAHLLGLWGLPIGVLEATALHHQPGRTANKEFSALTAVHVANVLQYTLTPEVDGQVTPKIDMEYLQEIGLVACLPAWCTEILGSEAANGYLNPKGATDCDSLPPKTLASSPPPASTLTTSEPQLEDFPGKEVSPSPELVPVDSSTEASEDSSLPVSEEAVILDKSPEAVADADLDHCSAESETQEPFETQGLILSIPVPEAAAEIPKVERSGNRTTQLVVAGVVAISLLLGWFIFGRQSKSSQEPLVVNAHQAQPGNAADQKNLAANSSDESSHSATSPGDTANSSTSRTEAPATVPVAATAEKATATNSPSADDATQTMAATQPHFPEMKLQGILYSPRRPAAIINGALVHTNDVLTGVKILEIRSTSVIIQFQNRRETLSLE